MSSQSSNHGLDLGGAGYSQNNFSKILVCFSLYTPISSTIGASAGIIDMCYCFLKDTTTLLFMFSTSIDWNVLPSDTPWLP